MTSTKEKTGTHVEHVVAGSSEQHSKVSLRALLIVLAIATTYFAQLVNIVGSGALARDITTVIGGSAQSVWFTSSIAILTVVLSPPVTQAADYWGRKWLLVVLTACGCIGAIIISRSSNITQAIAGFTVSGISYGAQPLLHAVSSEVLPRKYRPFAQAGINVAAALGGVFALLVGGALTRNYRSERFRTYWYIAAGLYAGATTVVALLYRPPPRELQITLSQGEKLRRLDWIGYGLLVPALTLFAMGLSWAQNPYAWTDAHVLAPFVVGVVLAGALILWETRFKRDGLFNHEMFHHRNFPIALFCVFTEGLVFFTANNYFAFEVATLYPQDSLHVGLHYSVAFFTYAVFAIVGAAYCLVTKSVRFATCAAFSMFLIFNVLMATTKIITPEQNLWGYAVFLGVGLGVCLTTLLTAAQFATPPHLIAITSGLMISIRSLGGSVGLPIYGAIFNAALSSNIASRVAGTAIGLGLPPTSVEPFISALVSHNTTAAELLPGSTPAIVQAGTRGLLESFAAGFRNVWITAASFSAVAVIASCFLVDPKTSFDNRVDAPLQPSEQSSAGSLRVDAS